VGGPKAYRWEASVDTPAASAFRQDCVRQNRDQRLQRGQGADAQSAPCSAHERSRRREQQGGKALGPKWAASNGLWCQSGLAKIFIGPKVVHTGQAMAGRPYPATPIWRIQLWGEMAMKWSQAMCASILVDEFYLLSLQAGSNSRSGRDVPGVPLEPALRPSLFTAHWGLPPKSVPTRSPKPQADVS